MRVLKIFIGLVIMVFSISSVLAEDAIINIDEGYNKTAWSICVWDDDIDVSAELVTELATSYAQLSAAATLEALRGLHSATADITLVGIDSNGNQISEVVRVTTNTSVASVNTFKYLDQAYASPESTTVTTIQKGDSDTFVTSIPATTTVAGMAQHFSGEKFSYITGWGGTKEGLFNTDVGAVTGEVILTLRYYQDDGDCLDAYDGYRMLDRICLSKGNPIGFREFSTPIKCAKNSWIAVYASADVANSDVTAIMQGYDSKR